ncbi:MAG: primosomal replication protein N [Rhodocyclaceae bacterium]|jgi:primosomal replication protein N|nr:primosomal replication protein N [Rhodocyclaceae bacterium]
MSSNRTELTGSLSERGVLRHTPAGVPVIEFRISHGSEQMEAGLPRQVECELACVAVGTVALLLKEAAPGTVLKVEGFLAARSLRQRTPVLHATAIEFEENIRTN